MNTNDLFWTIINESGPDCCNIDSIIKNYIKKYGEGITDDLDKEYLKYKTFFESKLEPILKSNYDEENENYLNFFNHVLSYGKEGFHKILNQKYEKKYHTIHLDEFDINYNINETLFDEFSEYQHIEVFNTKNLGNILSIDNDLQFGEFDEHKYHEMISNVPINYFQKDLNILIIGGGDGGVAREALKHNNVKKVTLIEIDKLVVDVTKKFFPDLSKVYNDPRLDLRIQDGLKFVNEYNGPKFDIIILDLTDFNQSNPLHESQFLVSLEKILEKESIICFNFDNFTINNEYLYEKLKELKPLFKYIQPFGVYIPSFGGGYYSFCMISNSIDPKSKINWDYFYSKSVDTKYYSPKIHLSSFVFPNEVSKQLSQIFGNKMISKKPIQRINVDILFGKSDTNPNDLEVIKGIFEKISQLLTDNSVKILDTTESLIILKDGHVSIYLDSSSNIYVNMILMNRLLNNPNFIDSSFISKFINELDLIYKFSFTNYKIKS